jgi:gliding motility-associated-like protein
MKRLFILACVFLLQVSHNLSAQCNRPNPSDNPCNASTFCNTAQLDAFCSTVTTPIANKVYIKPNGFCGTLESPSWFKFVAETPTLSLRFTATACGADGVQAVMLSTTNCSDAATYTAVSNCSNAMGGQPISTLTATNLVAGQVYYIMVDGYQGAGCNYAIDVVTGTIRATAVPLPTPSVIFGPTTVCTGATNVTFSVPKVPNATDYHFVVRNTTANTLIFDGVKADSFFTVPTFPATGTVRVTVSYKNDCTEGPVLFSDISINTIVNVTLPTVYLCPNSFYTAPDGVIFDNIGGNIPVADDFKDYETGPKMGVNGCDTIFKVKIWNYAFRTGETSLFLKPNEKRDICNKTIIGATLCGRRDTSVICLGSALNGCDSTVNASIFNAKETHTITPSSPTLNCNSVLLRAIHADTCTETVHIERYEWYFQTALNAPLSNLNNATATQTAATAGIYVLVVKDSVYSKTVAYKGYRVFTDTIRNTVTGNGSAGAITTPSAINGRADTTVCQGAVATFKINKVPNATSYSWSFARNGGRIIGAANDTSVVVQWAGNTSGDTLFVRSKNSCDSSAPQKIAILIINFANLDAGPDKTVCGLQTTLAGVSSTGTGKWTTISATGATFANDALPTSGVTAPSAGLYKFVWTETLGACTKSDTVFVTFAAPPQYTSFKGDSCNVTRTSFVVTFKILGGTPPFTVTNNATMLSVGSINAAGNFTSNPLPTGSYNLIIKDANNCASSLIPASQLCTACFTKSGTMDTTALSVCEGDAARGTYLSGYNSDGNDTLQFVLHTGNPKTGIVQRSYTPIFSFVAGMTYETRYFISAIAGDDSSRQVKLSDACFSVSAGVAVVFHKKPTASFTLDAPNLCIGDCTNLRYTLTGKTPYMVTTRVTDIGSRDTMVTTRLSPYILPICPNINTTYQLISISDSFGCETKNLTQQVSVKTFVPVDAGTPRAPLSTCFGVDTSVNLLTQLIGALQGGTWTETSTVKSTGTAFNAAAPSFRTRGQIAGTYRFSYVVKQVNGSPCPADTATVTFLIKTAPISNAGPNDTLTCNKTSINLGAANTSTGVGISYKWSGGNAGGNAPNITVSEPGTFILTVISPTCSSMDTVVIYIDTVSPRAIISPVPVKILTCKLDTITLNGSTSTPLGKISYAWKRGNTPQNNIDIIRITSGDTYTLNVRSEVNGCIGTDVIKIDENRKLPSVIIRKPALVNCKDSIVTIDASSSSTSVPYVLKWVTDNGGKFVSDSTTLLPKTRTKGYYKLTVQDTSNGCFASEFTFINDLDTMRPLANAVALDTIDCNNPTINLSGRGSKLGAAINYRWIARPGHIVSGENTLNAVADEPGVYILTVENTLNFCSNSDTAVVIRNTERPRNIKISIKKPSCYGECDANFKIDTVAGGTKPYLYSTDGKVFTTRNLFQNQCAGTFKLFIQDAGGCQIDSTFSINQDKQLAVALGGDTTVKLGDTLVLRVQTNADSIKSIVWTPAGDSTKCPKGGLCFEQTVRPIVGTSYQATINTKNGCSATGTVRVSIDKNRPIFIPNIFSPDNSGKNDVLMIYGSSVVKVIKRFQIYDRWGNGLFLKQNFQTDDPAFGWDGTIRGKNALPEVYVYFIEVVYQDNTTEIIQGDFTLIR